MRPKEDCKTRATMTLPIEILFNFYLPNFYFLKLNNLIIAILDGQTSTN